MASQLTLNLIEGSVTFSFTPEAASNLQAAIATLMERLKATSTQRTTGARAQPQKPVEYQHMGDVFLEVFCNPNIWPSPFAAKVLITLRDDRMRLTAEAELMRVIEDLSQYLEHEGK